MGLCSSGPRVVDDILAARAHSRRLAELEASTPGTRESKARLKRYLQDLIVHSQPVSSRYGAGLRERADIGAPHIRPLTLRYGRVTLSLLAHILQMRIQCF